MATLINHVKSTCWAPARPARRRPSALRNFHGSQRKAIDVLREDRQSIMYIHVYEYVLIYVYEYIYIYI